MAFTVEEKETAAGAEPAQDAEPRGSGELAVPPYEPEPWLRLAPLVVLGGISGIAYYLGFVTPYRMSVYYKQPLMDLAKINGHNAQSANAWAITWIVLFICYFLAFRLCPPVANASAAFRRVGLFII